MSSSASTLDLLAISETGLTYSFGQSGQIVFVGSTRRESAFVADEFPPLGGGDSRAVSVTQIP